MSTPEAWTVGRLLTWTTDFLKRHEADAPRLDAEVLLAHALGCERIELYTAYAAEVGEDARSVFRDLVKRRSEGAPVAYLVGRREFFSLSFRVTPDVLIPRPETEFLVLAAVDELKRTNSEREPRVADVGTGSGVIAVAVAKHAPRARVVASDISPAALALARENAEAHGVAERIEFVQGDLLEAVAGGAQFDIVVSNPPYIGEGEFPGLAREVREHEPRQALIGGPSGGELIARLIPQAAERLLPGGYFLCEISPQLESFVNARLAADGRFDTDPAIKDLAQLPRVARARRK